MAKLGNLTTAEAARRLGVHRKTVIRLVVRGRLVPIQKLPGQTGAYLLSEADVDGLAAERSAR